MLDINRPITEAGDPTERDAHWRLRDGVWMRRGDIASPVWQEARTPHLRRSHQAAQERESQQGERERAARLKVEAASWLSSYERDAPTNSAHVGEHREGDHAGAAREEVAGFGALCRRGLTRPWVGSYTIPFLIILLSLWDEPLEMLLHLRERALIVAPTQSIVALIGPALTRQQHLFLSVKYMSSALHFLPEGLFFPHSAFR